MYRALLGRLRTLGRSVLCRGFVRPRRANVSQMPDLPKESRQRRGMRRRSREIGRYVRDLGEALRRDIKLETGAGNLPATGPDRASRESEKNDC